MSENRGKDRRIVRKIIKYVGYGQLDECSLTLKDLDIVAKSFMQVFSGYFHEREEYSELNAKKGVRVFSKFRVGNIINNEKKEEKWSIMEVLIETFKIKYIIRILSVSLFIKQLNFA